MDIVKIVGIGPYSFTDEKTDRTITGFKFHCVGRAPTNNPHFSGEQVFTFSASAQLADNWAQDGIEFPKLGKRYYVNYNRYGKLDFMSPVPDQLSMELPETAAEKAAKNK